MHYSKTFLLLFFLIAGSYALQAQPDPSITKAESLKSNVVKLEVQYEDGGTGYGFGFVTNEQDGQLFVVTAAHVTHDPEFERNPRRITISFSNSLEQKVARELRWFEEDDLALLRVEKPVGYRWQRDFVASNIERYHSVRFFGDDFFVLDGGEIVAIQDNRFLRFTPSFVYPGISGAPLINSAGIVGMITTDSRETARATSIQQIRNRLQVSTGDSPYFYESGSSSTSQTVPVKSQIALDNFVKITGGSFEMGDQFNEGDDDEKPVHTVRVSDFMMSPTEVSLAEFKQFIDDTDYTTTAEEKGGSYIWNGSEMKLTSGVDWQYDQSGKRRSTSQYDHPVLHVSWHDAVAYCNWKSEQAGLQKVYTISAASVSANWSANGYRLPTEAEWEYAAREGGRKVRFGNGENIADANEMNFDARSDYKENYSRVGSYRQATMSVKSLKRNSLGLYHMSGNVWVWCWDWYGEDYYSKSDNASDPKGPASGSRRVVRGGSWVNVPVFCRATDRGGSYPSSRGGYIGFRLVRHAP